MYDNKLVILDFSRIYENEKFYRSENVTWLDMTNIIGTNGYCSVEAERLIRDKIKNLSPKGLHFIDSGNYHYISEFWMDKINYNFKLVVFDHHSDMQKPLFGDLLTCGSWIMRELERNKYLKEVVFVGLNKDQQKVIDPKYYNRLKFLSSLEQLNKIYQNHKNMDLPLYISIDKDILSKSTVNTIWDQGDMKLHELGQFLHTLILNENIIGIDICGECADVIGDIYDIRKSDLVNKKLLEFIKREIHNEQ